MGDSCGKTSLVWRAVHKEEELGTFVPTVLLEQEVRSVSHRVGKERKYKDLLVVLWKVHNNNRRINL